MTMLIDISYFTKGSRHIQNATISPMGLDQRAVNAAIESFIEEYQPVYLKAVLGEREARNVENYLDLLTEEESTSPSKYEEVCKRLKEPFANYVFFNILRNVNIHSTITGTVKLKCANEYVSPIRKQVEVWNNMVDENKDFLKWVRESSIGLSIETETNMLIKVNIFNI